MLKYDGYTYCFSPYDLIWNNDSYYVLGWSQKHEKIVKFRVDRMHQTKISAIDYHPCPDNYSIREYCEQVFLMYDGITTTVKLRCDNGLMKTIIDRFGEDVETRVLDNDSFLATVKIAVSPVFYSWIFNYCGMIQIVEPENVKKEYRARIKQAYCNL